MKKFIVFFISILLNSISQSQTQYPPVSPKWVFEPWVWEDAINTEDAVNDLVDNYASYNIPVGAIIIDSPWETGYNTFLFDQTRYNDPNTFIHSLRSKNIHVILWITGVITTDCKPLYDSAKSKGYFINNGDTTTFWKGSGWASHIDFFNSAAVQFWESLMDKVLDSLEVDGWKVDESDYNVREFNIITTSAGEVITKEEYSAAYYKEMYKYIHSLRADTGMIMARPFCKQNAGDPYTYAPVSVNTAGWVGDQRNTWDGLQNAFNSIFISAHLGYAAVGSDIGGYVDTSLFDPELFVRWMQFSALLPIMENGGKTANKHQPWAFGDNNILNSYRYYAKLHRELVPYLYSYDIVSHLTGKPIVTALGERKPPPEDYIWDGHAYLLGDNIFVAAIFQESNSRSMTFPDGSWINYWVENDIHDGGTRATLDYPVDQYPARYPIFIRSGAIIPMNVDNSITGHGSSASKKYLTLLIYPHGTSSYRYYTDTLNYNDIKCSENSTGFKISFSKNTDSLIIRLKNNIEPESVSLHGAGNLDKKNSFADFDSSSAGWFQGKMPNGDNVYTWVKFINAADTVYVNTSVVSNIAPPEYELSRLTKGNKYYIDRIYTLTSIPSEYEGLYMIKTRNADKAVSPFDFHFDLSCSAKVYVAYDHRLADDPPDWLKNNYSKLNAKEILTSDPETIFDIWEKTSLSSGPENFGINKGIIGASSMYFVFFNTQVFIVNIKVFLQGPYNTTNHNMNTNLRSLSSFPKEQPFNCAPWNYPGLENVLTIPTGVVDWVLVQLRTGTSSSTTLATCAAFLKNDGTVVDLNGTSYMSFTDVPSGDYYVVIKHRNHLAVMSAVKVSFPNSSTYDFRIGSNKYYGGTAATVQTETGIWGMIAGDTNGDGGIGVQDYSKYKITQGQEGYDKIADFNCDGGVGVEDYSLYKLNQGKETSVP